MGTKLKDRIYIGGCLVATKEEDGKLLYFNRAQKIWMEVPRYEGWQI